MTCVSYDDDTISRMSLSKTARVTQSVWPRSVRKHSRSSRRHSLMYVSAPPETMYESSIEHETECTPARWPLAESSLPPRSHVIFQPVSWLIGLVWFSQMRTRPSSHPVAKAIE